MRFCALTRCNPGLNNFNLILSKFLWLIFNLKLKGTAAGILRSVGAQFYCSIILFVSFYVIGLPIGISLLLKTSLELYGIHGTNYFLILKSQYK